MISCLGLCSMWKWVVNGRMQFPRMRGEGKCHRCMFGVRRSASMHALSDGECRRRIDLGRLSDESNNSWSLARAWCTSHVRCEWLPSASNLICALRSSNMPPTSGLLSRCDWQRGMGTTCAPFFSSNESVKRRSVSTLAHPRLCVMPSARSDGIVRFRV